MTVTAFLAAIAAVVACVVLGACVDGLHKRVGWLERLRADAAGDARTARIHATAAERDAAVARSRVEALALGTLDTTCDLDVPEVDAADFADGDLQDFPGLGLTHVEDADPETEPTVRSSDE